MEKTTKKMTKKELFKAIKGVLEEKTPEKKALIEFCDHELELLDKKTANRSGKKVKEEDVVFMEKIVKLAGESLVTATDISKALDISNQKAAALCKKLMEEGKLSKDTDNKKIVYAANFSEEEEIAEELELDDILNEMELEEEEE